MYEPVLMAQAAFDRLTERQQDALFVATRMAEAFGYERAAYSDEVLVGLYQLSGVKVAEMTPAQVAEWQLLAERTAYRAFSAKVENGAALLALARAVR
jgi:TRAP-type C4-dicarboxylate transport system substrate-binding protein